jgi:hypothetical protein
MHYIKSLASFLLFFIVCNDVHAQVPVIKEPHHKPVLINKYVRLLDVHLNAGDTTQYHIHATPSVIVIISNSTIGMQKMGEAPSAPGNTTAGSVSFVDYGTNPITHRVFNAGNNVFHVMDIEIVPRKPSADSFSVLKQSNIETIVNEKLVRTYKLDIDAHQSLNIDKSSSAHLLICVDGEVSASNKTITTGEYVFFNPDTEITLSNKNTGKSTCVVLELK